MKASQRLPARDPSPFGTQDGPPEGGRPPCTRCGVPVEHWSAADRRWYRLCKSCHAEQLVRWKRQRRQQRQRSDDVAAEMTLPPLAAPVALTAAHIDTGRRRLPDVRERLAAARLLVAAATEAVADAKHEIARDDPKEMIPWDHLQQTLPPGARQKEDE